MMIRPLLLGICFFTSFVFADDIDTLIANRLPNAHIGYELRAVDTGKVLMSKHADQSFTPASSLKVMTASAALMALGKEYHYETSIWVKKKSLKKHKLKANVWWKFTGDPSFTSEHLTSIVQALKHQGIQEIEGDILIDQSAFSGAFYPWGWTEDSLAWYFFAPVTALMIDQNRFSVSVMPGKHLGDTLAVQATSTTAPMQLSSEIEAVSDEDAKHCRMNASTTAWNQIHFSGCWPLSQGKSRLHLAFRYPHQVAIEKIKQSLAHQGILLKGKVRVSPTPMPEGLKRIVHHESVPLSRLIQSMLKNSDNMISESLLKTLGRQYGRSGTFVEGLKVRENLLSSYAGLNFSASDLYDGSGGSSYNLVTPHQMAQLMYVIANDKKMDVLKKALPIAGQDGTLSKRMKVFNLKQHVRAKTGSMKHTSSLTGLMTNAYGQVLAFSILMDHIVEPTKEARALQDELCQMWYTTQF